MIKQSLAELRGKLDRMRRDKDAVNVGINSYESKSYHWRINYRVTYEWRQQTNYWNLKNQIAYRDGLRQTNEKNIFIEHKVFCSFP